MKIEVYKQTEDEWYPSYWSEELANMVRVVYLDFIDHSGYRVAVWGADDCGMEKDFLYSKLDIEMSTSHRNFINSTVLLDSHHCFMKVISQEFVNKKWLKEQGFVNA